MITSQRDTLVKLAEKMHLPGRMSIKETEAFHHLVRQYHTISLHSVDAQKSRDGGDPQVHEKTFDNTHAHPTPRLSPQLHSIGQELIMYAQSNAAKR